MKKSILILVALAIVMSIAPATRAGDADLSANKEGIKKSFVLDGFLMKSRTETPKGLKGEIVVTEEIVTNPVALTCVYFFAIFFLVGSFICINGFRDSGPKRMIAFMHFTFLFFLLLQFPIFKFSVVHAGTVLADLDLHFMGILISAGICLCVGLFVVNKHFAAFFAVASGLTFTASTAFLLSESFWHYFFLVLIAAIICPFISWLASKAITLAATQVLKAIG